jgi:phage regulator Rha-like protein
MGGLCSWSSRKREIVKKVKIFPSKVKQNTSTRIYIGIALEVNMSNKLLSIKNKIFEIRGQKIMLDRDLAELYGVEVKRLNEATKRNIRRFPKDFMFQLKKKEWDNLRSQIATAKKDVSKVRFLPFAFTEHGVLMLSNVLYSERAINMSVQIIKVFNELRKYALKQTLKDTQIAELHKLLMLHIENNDYKFSEYDETIRHIVQALNNLLVQPKKTGRIGFITGE